MECKWIYYASKLEKYTYTYKILDFNSVRILPLDPIACSLWSYCAGIYFCVLFSLQQMQTRFSFVSEEQTISSSVVFIDIRTSGTLHCFAHVKSYQQQYEYHPKKCARILVVNSKFPSMRAVYSSYVPFWVCVCFEWFFVDLLLLFRTSANVVEHTERERTQTTRNTTLDERTYVY